MANQYVNKVVVGGVTKLDLTGDTVDASKILNGYTAHDRSGAPITGTSPFNADTSDTSLTANEALSGETFYGPTGQKVTGSMPNRGSASGTISTKDDSYTIQQGYHDGSGTVSIDSAEQSKIVASNIKQGVTILGVTGDYGGEEINVESNKNVTPSFTEQAITPSTGYDYLAQVTVAAIPITYSDNPQGGQTMTVG